MKNKIGIYVFSRETVKSFVTDLPYFWINIYEPDLKPSDNLNNPNEIARLNLPFWDIDRKDVLAKETFCEIDAKCILTVLNKVQKNIKLIIISCDNGLTSSPAVAAALSRIMYDDEMNFFAKPYTPFFYVYHTILRVSRDVAPIGE
jgi:hypothetical protein